MPCRVQARFEDPLWDEVQQLSGYIKEILGTLVTLHKQTPVTKASSNTKTTTAVVGFFVAGVVVCNAMYFPNVIR